MECYPLSEEGGFDLLPAQLLTSKPRRTMWFLNQFVTKPLGVMIEKLRSTVKVS